MLTIEEPKPKEGVVTVSGLEREFGLLDPKSLKVSLDMAQIKPGWQMFLITRQDVRLPGNLNLERIEPSLLRLNVTELIPMEVGVEVQTAGSLKKGYILDKIEVKPSRVQVIASPNLRDSEVKVYTDPIDLSQLTETTTLTPKLAIPTSVRFPTGKYPEVKVKLIINKIQEPAKEPSPKEEQAEPNNLIKDGVIMQNEDPDLNIRK